ncbi:MAG: hypothetical protein ACK5PB_18010 [Pirellula sp.]|jgi:hypothetical protein
MSSEILTLIFSVLACANSGFAQVNIDEIVAKVRQKQSSLMGLTFEYRSSVEFNESAAVNEFNVYMIKFGAIRDLRKTHRKWMVFPEASTDSKVNFFYANRDSDSVLFQAEEVKEGASHGGTIFAQVQNSYLNNNLFDQLLLCTPFGPSYLQDPQGLFEERVKSHAKITQTSPTVLEITAEMNGVLFLSKVDTRLWMTVYSLVRTSAGEKLSEWEITNSSTSELGAVLPQSGSYYQKGFVAEDLKVPTVMYRFEVSKVYVTKPSQLEPWFPEFRPGTAVSNQVDGMNSFIPHDKIEMQEAMLQAARLRGMKPTLRFDWTVLTIVAFVVLGVIAFILHLRRGR